MKHIGTETVDCLISVICNTSIGIGIVVACISHGISVKCHVGIFICPNVSGRRYVCVFLSHSASGVEHVGAFIFHGVSGMDHVDVFISHNVFGMDHVGVFISHSVSIMASWYVAVWKCC